jgi:hypothetical protein
MPHLLSYAIAFSGSNVSVPPLYRRNVSGDLGLSRKMKHFLLDFFVYPIYYKENRLQKYYSVIDQLCELSLLSI